ncbi:unnamed protein product [Prunus armeniaca]|uniref:Uncharacterized protein n=1 Tax=Prunus armeniaca TaxID=36596 RepID=A0A6J5UIX2_PRUAR|nr:unnamed protein product [Prunus armeniaca]
MNAQYLQSADQDQDPEESKLVLKTFTDSKGATFCLKKELEMALDAFNKLYVRLATLISELDIGGCSQPAVSDEKNNFASSFLTKAHATIKEADVMLNALMEANENAKELTGLWKQTGEELMLEKASFIEEVEHLKNSCLTEELIHKIPCFNVGSGFHSSRQQEGLSITNKQQKMWSSCEDDIALTSNISKDNNDQSGVTNLKAGELSLSCDSLMHENLSLKEELQRKDALLEGLHFDFRMVQESASNTMDIKDETE